METAEVKYYCLYSSPVKFDYRKFLKDQTLGRRYS